MNGEILRETFMYGNVEVEFRSAMDNNEKQIQDIKYFINKGVDLIIVAPNESDALTQIIERAVDKNIPVVVVDRKINSQKYTSFIGANNFEIGKAVGDYISTKYTNGGKLIELTGLSNSSPAVDRHDGFISAISTNEKIQVLCREDANWLLKDAEVKMDSLLSVYDDIDIIFAHNDRMALGAYNAAKAKGREKDISFIGIDALPGEGFGLGLVKKGILDASFIYPTGGDKVLNTAMKILNKEPYEKEVTLNTAVVDASNVILMTLQTSQISELDQKVETLNGKVVSYISRYYTQKVVLYCSLVILLLVAILLIVTYYTLTEKSRLNKKLSEQKEQLERQYTQMVNLSKQLEIATQSKLVFFTNISHDFRTPLTLIADPIEQLLEAKSNNPDDVKLLKMIKRNTNILLRLVNQILDFRKYENGKMDFSPSCVNVKDNMEVWNDSFSSMSLRKHVHFNFIASDKGNFYTMADVEKLERIYFNILSNAFKFTPENGNVTVKLDDDVLYNGVSYIQFDVHNTGSVIEADNIEKVFDRFYKQDVQNTGSGIGLALVKAFVDLHQGVINVKSNAEEGTSFIVKIPKVICEQSENEVVRNNVSVAESIKNEDILIEEINSDTQSDNNEDKVTKVLIIDDNPDIRSYVSLILKDKYKTLEASNGAEGIKMAMKYIPDLVICDIMMPVIDGIECCRRLKSEMQTCHIPVILLTACTLDEQRIKGYSCGADSYLSKPFNRQVLITRVGNLIDTRSKLKQFFGDANSLVKENICDLDKDFVTKFKELIDSKMSNSELNVEDLGKEMGMSRVQLYRKLKSLTNYSPNELLRIARLKKSLTLLSAGDMTVSEVAYAVGFTSPSYFSKCYKEYFGENPTDIIHRNDIK